MAAVNILKTFACFEVLTVSKDFYLEIPSIVGEREIKAFLVREQRFMLEETGI
jgi:hypothetical protein